MHCNAADYQFGADESFCVSEMGRLRKRYNEKGRQKKDIKIQHAAEEKVWFAVISKSFQN